MVVLIGLLNAPHHAQTTPTLGDERVLFDNGNPLGVGNGPTEPATFTIRQPYVITLILDYHWNDGRGAGIGTIGLRDAAGRVYGPWAVKGSPGQGGVPNANWTAVPNARLPAGEYTIIDSEPSTWSQNSASGNRGFSRVKGYPSENPPPTHTSAAAVLVSQDILPSNREQTVSWKDQVRVTIPAGLVDSKQTLTIATAKDISPHPFKGLSPLATFDISLGNLHAFSKDLTIEIAYDLAKMKSDLSPENALMAMTWNPELKTWAMERFTVDTQRRVVIIRANHLSVEQVSSVAPPYTVYKPKHFIVVYDPKDAAQVLLPEQKVARRGGSRTLPLRAEPVSAEKMVADLGSYLDHAWDEYGRYPFKPLLGDANVDGKLWVFVDSALKVSEREKFSGNLYFPTNWVDTQYENGAEQMRHESAHELFHAVQNEYYTWVGMARRRWWMEATADYAAGVIAWGAAGTMPLVPANYFKKPIDFTEAKHDYKTSRFVEYLSRPAGSFKAMWDYVVPDSTGDVAGMLNLYLLQRNTDLDKEFRGFVAYVLFDSKGPLSSTLIDAEAERPVMNNGLLYSPAVEQVDILGADKTELSYSLPPIEKFTAAVWGIRVKTQVGKQRKLKIENTGYLNDLPDEKLDVYVLKNDVRPAGGVKPEGTLRRSAPTLTLRPLDNDDVVYIVGTNGGNGAKSLPVKVTDAAEESEWVGVWTGQFDSKSTFATESVWEPMTLTFRADGTVTVDGVLEYIQKNLKAIQAASGDKTQYRYDTPGTFPCVYNRDKVSVAPISYRKTVISAEREREIGHMYSESISLKGTKIGKVASGQLAIEDRYFSWRATKR
jgi:hypothetical protein